MSNALQPLSQANRDVSLDMLRGFALAGVLFTFCAGDVGSSAATTNSILDEAIKWTKWILIENRMYTMLIIIFGIGFHVQLEKAKRKGVSIAPVFMRRLGGLLLLGFFHAILLSTRDILMFYGVAGIVLLLVRRATNRELFLLMAVIFLVVVPIVVRFQAAGFKAFSLAQPNNYADHLQHNWQFFKLYHQIYFIYCEMIFYFMLGFFIGRVGLLQKIKTDRKFKKWLLYVSLAGAAVLIPFYYFWLNKVFPSFVTGLHYSWQKFLAVTFYRVVWMGLMLACVTLYAVVLINLSFSTRVGKWFSPLSPFGQMALSNYLIQSIVLVPYLLVFDKYNNLPAFDGFILFLIVLALQLVFSTWWMARYTLGPVEWLLRSFTYWKWQPIRKSPPEIKNYQPILLIKN